VLDPDLPGGGGAPEPEGRQHTGDRRLPGQLVLVHQLAEHQRGHGLGVGCHHEERAGVDLLAAAQLAGAEPAGEDDLSVLQQAYGDAGDLGRLHRALDERAELGDARLVESVGLAAGERLAAVTLREELAVDQRHLGPPLLAHGLAHVIDGHGPHAAGALNVHAHVALLVG
jgi:hypothetical protein